LSARALSQTPIRELTLRPLAAFYGPTSKGERKEREGKGGEESGG